MTATTYASLAPQSMITHQGDCIIEGDVGAGSCLRVTGGSLTIRGNVGRYTDIIVLREETAGFDAAWHDFLSVAADGDLAARRASGQRLRARFNAASAKGVSIGGTVGAAVRIACDGDVRIGGAVAEHARVVAQGAVHAPSVGMQSSLTAGGVLAISRIGALSTVSSADRALVTYIETGSEICARQIEGLRRKQAPAVCPRGAQDIYLGTQTGYFYSGGTVARLLRL